MKQSRPRPNFGRTLLDFAAVAPSRRISHSSVAGCPVGNGAAILVLPGILHHDAQTARFRDALRMLDYLPFGWEIGPNYGPTQEIMDRCKMRLAQLARQHGPVRLIGFSAGGLFARWLAQARPHLVAQVITVCTPFRDPLNSAWLPVRPFKSLWRHVDLEALSFMVAQPPPMEWGAVYSPIDGVVCWRSCMEPNAADQCRAVRVRHRYAMSEEAVLRAVAGLLAAAHQ